MKSFLGKSVVALSALMCSPVSAADSMWSIDPSHSTAEFAVKHMMVANVHGRFGNLSGSVEYDGQHVGNAKIDANISVSSINTDDAKRDEHLKSPDFFDLAKFPEIKFVSKQITEQNQELKIAGDLTIHGITKPVVLTAAPLSHAVRDPYGFTRLGTTAHAKLNRKDFGLAFDKTLDNGGAIVGDTVDVTLEIELTQKKVATLPNATSVANSK